MRSRAAMLMFLLAAVLSARGNETLFDLNPDHIWNRLHNQLFIRVAKDGSRYGLDSADILYWIRTQYSIDGDSHATTVKLLDEFIDSRAASLVQDPWKRALLQSRCWSLFDWAAQKPSFDEKSRAACDELQSRLATIIRQLALGSGEIERLPNNLASSRELSGLNELKGDWVQIQVPTDEMTAQAHTKYFGGRSVFTVMFRHPEGRAAATNYLAKLREFSPMWIWRTNDSQHIEPIANPGLPQFPEKSQWALVRRMCVIDTAGKIRATPIVESVQMRTFDKVPTSGKNLFEELKNSQRMQEFDIRASDASLMEVSASEKSFTHFLSKGFDPFEQRWNNAPPDPLKSLRPTLATCNECHGGRAGIHSVNTFFRFLSREPSMQTTRIEPANSWDNDNERTIRWKERQYSWGLLDGLAWKTRPK